MTLDECRVALEAMTTSPNHTFDHEEVQALEFAIGVCQWATRRPSESKLYRPFGGGIMAMDEDGRVIALGEPDE